MDDNILDKEVSDTLSAIHKEKDKAINILAHRNGLDTRELFSGKNNESGFVIHLQSRKEGETEYWEAILLRKVDEVKRTFTITVNMEAPTGGKPQ